MISLTPQTCSAQETIEHVKKEKRKGGSGEDCLLLSSLWQKGNTHTSLYTTSGKNRLNPEHPKQNI